MVGVIKDLGTVHIRPIFAIETMQRILLYDTEKHIQSFHQAP